MGRPTRDWSGCYEVQRGLRCGGTREKNALKKNRGNEKLRPNAKTSEKARKENEQRIQASANNAKNGET